MTSAAAAHNTFLRSTGPNYHIAGGSCRKLERQWAEDLWADQLKCQGNPAMRWMRKPRRSLERGVAAASPVREDYNCLARLRPGWGLCFSRFSN